MTAPMPDTFKDAYAVFTELIEFGNWHTTPPASLDGITDEGHRILHEAAGMKAATVWATNMAPSHEAIRTILWSAGQPSTDITDDQWSALTESVTRAVEGFVQRINEASARVE